jgi:hypothetical protein
MYTIKQFCVYAQISERHFHVLRAQGRAPGLTRLGKNLRITHEAATEWIEWMKQRTERMALMNVIARVSTPVSEPGCAP